MYRVPLCRTPGDYRSDACRSTWNEKRVNTRRRRTDEFWDNNRRTIRRVFDSYTAERSRNERKKRFIFFRFPRTVRRNDTRPLYTFVAKPYRYSNRYTAGGTRCCRSIFIKLISPDNCGGLD